MDKPHATDVSTWTAWQPVQLFDGRVGEIVSKPERADGAVGWRADFLPVKILDPQAIGGWEYLAEERVSLEGARNLLVSSPEAASKVAN